jgi:1-acyl-sn-glycerol-3-phosphate acyltransferase
LADPRAPAAAAFRAWGRWYVERQLASGLDGVHVHGLDEASRVIASSPTIVAANHVCWWDGLLFVSLVRRLGGRGAVLVDQAQLARFAFFRPFGAIGIDRASPLAARRGLARAAECLRQPGDVLWMFPQGQHTSPHRRPLGLSRGVELLARRTGATILPVAVQYPFLSAPRPAAFVRFAPPVADLEGLEVALVRELEAIDDEVAHQATLPARAGRAARALGWLTGWMGVGRA